MDDKPDRSALPEAVAPTGAEPVTPDLAPTNDSGLAGQSAVTKTNALIGTSAVSAFVEGGFQKLADAAVALDRVRALTQAALDTEPSLGSSLIALPRALLLEALGMNEVAPDDSAPA